ncbi:MAG: hypothetical protein F4X97_13515 [Boseongicola sp. SB0662_bin_57]|nr:hypothetical protein [Boseongicola sp. SB0662_bin_57]
MSSLQGEPACGSDWAMPALTKGTKLLDRLVTSGWAEVPRFPPSRPAGDASNGSTRCLLAGTHRHGGETQRNARLEPVVAENRTCADHGLTGTDLDHPLAALREGDTLVASRLRPGSPPRRS